MPLWRWNRLLEGKCFTFTSANDQILICTAKGRPNDVFSLLLAQKPSRDFRRLDLNQLHFSVRHVDKHIPAILADAHTRHVRFQHKAVKLFLGRIIVYKDLALGRDGDEALAVGRYGTVLNSVVGWPAVELIAFETPEAKLGRFVERACHEVCTVRSPGGSRHRLSMMIYSKNALAGLCTEVSVYEG